MARSELHLIPEELERFVKRVEKLLAEGLPILEIARAFGISPTTVRNRVRKYNGENPRP
jgi:DNA-binding NarL/FixJ family response regulator